MVGWWFAFWVGGGLRFPASAGIPRCRFAPAPPSLRERGVPPLSFGHFPMNGGTLTARPPLGSPSEMGRG